jgi:hypothetical protein
LRLDLTELTFTGGITMHLNFPGMQGMGVTTFQSTNSTSFMYIANVKNQIGMAIFTGTSGIEVAGIGVSYGPQSFTLINGVTQTLTFMNSNGSSLLLAINGAGLPVFNTVLEPTSIFTGAPVWLSSRANGLTITVAYATSDAFGNQ